MSIVAVASAKASPGASTAAELLALLAPQPPGLLVDCDPAGGAWRLRPGVRPEPGLVSLAMAARRGPTEALVESHAQRVGEDLEVVVSPPAARQVVGALDVLAPSLGPLVAATPRSVVVDCGRLGPNAAVAGVLAEAGLVVVATRATVGEMVHLAPWVEQLRAERAPVVVLLIERPRRAPPGVLYGAQEVAEALGVGVFGPLAWDSAGVEAMRAAPGQLAALRRTRLLRSGDPIAQGIWAMAADPRPADERANVPEEVIRA